MVTKIYIYLNKIIDTKFIIIHRIFLYLLEKIYYFFNEYVLIEQSKFIKELLPFAAQYHRYYGEFESYFKLKNRLLINLNHEAQLRNIDISEVKFELYAYSDNKDKKNKMLKAIKDEVAKENIQRIKELKKVFSKKKVLIMGPSKITNSIKLEKFDLIALANTKLIGSFNKKVIDDSKIVMFVNLGYYYRNEIRLRNNINNVAAIFVKPMIDSSFPKFIMPNKLMYNDYGPMGMQNMIYSIYAGEAKSIYVTGVTGYLGDEIYRDGIKTYRDNFQHYSNNIRRHEPISNFCFIKNFVDLGLCSGDETFLKIFNNDVYRYCISLDKLYSNYIFKRINNSKLHSK